MKWLLGLVCFASMLSAGVERQFEQQQTVNVTDGKRLTVTVDFASTKAAILTQTADAKVTFTMSATPNVKLTATASPSPSPTPKGP